MDDEDDINICNELWNDLDNYSSCSMKFGAPIAAGFRFRYQSEIEKKSYSLLKAEKNSSPTIEVDINMQDFDLKVELITSNLCPHFNMLYEVPKDKFHKPSVVDGIYYARLSQPGRYIIKLDLGIRKMKNKEAMVRIKELYPQMTDIDAKSFFNNHKDIVRLKATLSQHDIPALEITSEIIKSQISKENKSIKIKHFAPKVVAETGEQLIIVLEKKITTEKFISAIQIFENTIQIAPVEQDGQTFIFNIPTIKCSNPTEGFFIMSCDDSTDSKPIKFLPSQTEQRKRKNCESFMQNSVPLKRPNKFDNQDNIPQPLYPESISREVIQTDGVQDRIKINNTLENFVDMRNDSNSSKDSGIHCDDRSQHEDSSTFDESVDESGDEFIETEGFSRKRIINSEPTKVISVPPLPRANSSHLDINVFTTSTKKILSEVARIGHDFAFGKMPDDLFERIEKQLPVVFTLQDDVGDTPLNNAILKGNVEHAFRILNIVRTNCDWALDLVNTSGHTALILAPACEVPPELIEKLLNAGCKLDIWDDTGKSAITYAIEYQNVKALEVLLKHAKMRNLRNVLLRQSTNYYSPLQIAVMNNFKIGVEMLVNLKDTTGHKYLVDVNETGLMNEETALHIAVSHACDTDIIKVLLKRTDLNINQTSWNQTTALHIANKMKLHSISKLLKEYNAVDLSNNHDVEMLESDEDCEEEMEDQDSFNSDSVQLESNKNAINETTDEENSDRSIKMITNSLKELSLKGPIKMKFVDILILSDGPTLTVKELQEIVKPTFKSLFNKYGNTNENKRDISELLDRFNCLPNSGGQLIDSLRRLGREDLIRKIEQKWSMD